MGRFYGEADRVTFVLSNCNIHAKAEHSGEDGPCRVRLYRAQPMNETFRD